MLRAAALAVASLAADGFSQMLARGASLAAGLRRPAAEHGSRMAEAASASISLALSADAAEAASDAGADSGAAARRARDSAMRAAGDLRPKIRDAARYMAEDARRAYLREANRAAVEARSGAKTQPQAVRDAVSRLAERGLDCMSHTRRDGTVVRVPVDVGIRRMVEGRCAEEMTEQAIRITRETGGNLVDVPAHRGARPSHAAWHGRTYRLEGSDAEHPNYYEACRVGDPVDGLGGYGCRHAVRVHADGFEPEPPVPMDQAEREYAATQKQRSLERDIRRLKRAKLLLEECGLDARPENVRIRAKQAELRAHVAANGGFLKRETHRERAYSNGRAGSLTHREARRVTEETRKAAAEAERRRRLSEGIARARSELRGRVSAGSIGVLAGKQNKHVVGSKEFERKVESCMKRGYKSPSYLTISVEEAERLVRRHAGTGEPALDGKGMWNGKEKCVSSGIIGMVVTKGGEHVPTAGFTIHYSKNGVHIVPRRVEG